MKKIVILIFSLLFVLCTYAQLNADHNGLRAGDTLVKQQVEFKNPGKAGANQTWDFSNLKLINEEYELVYSEAPLIGDSLYIMGYKEFPKKEAKFMDLIVGTEHNTMYYFTQSKNSLNLIGHENIAVKQENIQPIIDLKFPLNYGGAESSSSYQTKGLYSGIVNIQSEGRISMSADAFGKIILPSGDTINPVVRVKTQQSILDTSNDLQAEGENDKGRILKNYRWYSKGYRYPIFETVECLNLNNDSTIFSTAFFFPPQDHLYLESDPENLALLEELWKFTDKERNPFKKIDPFENKKGKSNYVVYPNPVETTLNIEYTLEEDSPVNIIMTTIDGKVVKNIFKKKQQAGMQIEQIECSNLMTGGYILKVIAGGLVINEKIIKR